MTNSNANFVNVSELMKLAIQFEKDAASYYHTMQGTTENSEAIAILKILEKEEAQHAVILENFDINDIKNQVLQFPPDFSLSMPVLKSDNPGRDELLDIAIAREKQSTKLYNNAAAVSGGELAELLKGLASFEEQHVVKLESFRQYY